VQSVSLSSDASGATVDADPLVNRPLAELGRLSQEVVRELRRRIRQLHPDVVLANGSATLKYTAAAVAGMRNPPAFVYASIGEPSYWAQGTSRRLAQRLLLSRVDLIAAVSAATAHQLVAEFGVRDSKTVVAYTGVPERFLTVDRVQRSIDELRILMIGALTKEKQPHLGVRVLAELRKTQAARLRLVGAGNLTDMVAAEARSQGVEPETELVGSVDDIGPHLEWADVLLLTSSTEGLPGVVLEAAAVGVPSVAFDVGGTREAIVNGVTGYVVDPQDVAAAARCLADLAEQSRKLIGLGAAARERIRNEFTMSHAIDRYADLLEQAGAVRPRRRNR
jgi:glycosyltransferase involved in cell wall biosynthesis